MIKRLIYVFCFVILNNFNNYANSQSNIIVKVENEIITNYDIKNKILSSLYLANQSINQQNINKIKANALDSCIQNKLKKIELSKFNIKNDIEQVNRYIKSITSRDVPSLKAEFNKNNIDFDLFLEKYRNRNKVAKIYL